MVARVLVADDEDQIRRVLDHYLRAEGFEVAEAATGRDALALAATRATRPDIVLLDIGLADMTGLEVLARIRADSDLPVILVTARTEEVDTLVGFSVGADDYVTKPFSPREVAARVRSVLRRAGHGPGAATDWTSRSTSLPNRSRWRQTPTASRRSRPTSSATPCAPPTAAGRSWWPPGRPRRAPR